MTGIEIMEVCKERTECEDCPVKRECQSWKEQLLGAEPWQLGDLMDEKEY